MIIKMHINRHPTYEELLMQALEGRIEPENTHSGTSVAIVSPETSAKEKISTATHTTHIQPRKT